jgi:steroid 5-alpha reductase family enzyme
LKSNYPKSYKLFFLLNYQLQGVLLMFTSSSLYWAFYRRSQDPTSICWQEWITWSVGMALASKGLIMEAIADKQLETWKKNFQQQNALRAQALDHNNGDYQLANKEGLSPDEMPNEGKPLNNADLKMKFHRSCIEGLWARTRHPNLWYELEFWLGYAIIGIGDGGSWIRIFPFLGPVCLWAVMYFLTIPLTEKTMKPNRADYWDEYCKKYNMLLPNRWP